MGDPTTQLTRKPKDPQPKNQERGPEWINICFFGISDLNWYKDYLILRGDHFALSCPYRATRTLRCAGKIC